MLTNLQTGHLNNFLDWKLFKSIPGPFLPKSNLQLDYISRGRYFYTKTSLHSVPRKMNWSVVRDIFFFFYFFSFPIFRQNDQIFQLASEPSTNCDVKWGKRLARTNCMQATFPSHLSDHDYVECCNKRLTSTTDQIKRDFPKVEKEESDDLSVTNCGDDDAKCSTPNPGWFGKGYSKGRRRRKKIRWTFCDSIFVLWTILRRRSCDNRSELTISSKVHPWRWECRIRLAGYWCWAPLPIVVFRRSKIFINWIALKFPFMSPITVAEFELI